MRREDTAILSDHILLKRYATRRDPEAFVELTGRYAGLVYGVCLRVLQNEEDAHDTAQECFLELARKTGSVKSSLPAWLHKLARSRSVDFIRRASTRRKYEQEAASAAHDGEPAWSEIAPLVDAAIDSLPDRLREPVILHYLHGYTQSEVAMQLGLNQSTVSRDLEKGIASLREDLKKAGVVVTAAALAIMLTQNTSTAVPAALTASLGSMAASGVGGISVIAGMSGLAGTITAKLIIGVIAVSCVGVVAYRVRGNAPQSPAIKVERPLKASAKDKAEIILLIDANAKSLAAIKSGSGTTRTTSSGIDSLNGTDREYEHESTEKNVFSGYFFRERATARYIKGGGADNVGMVPEGSIRTTEWSNNDKESRMLYVESKSGYIYPANRNCKVFGVYYAPATVAACKKGESGIVGYESVDGDKCTIVEFRGKTPVDGKFNNWTADIWYNPSKGCAMVKQRFWQSMDGGPKLLSKETMAEMYECASGIWLPARLEMSIYGKDPRTGKQRLTCKVVTIPNSDYQVNIPIDRSQFTLEFPSGTKVQDLVKRTKYTVP